MFRLPAEPQTIGEVIANSFRIYWQSLPKLFPIALMLSLIAFIPSILESWHDLTEVQSRVLGFLFVFPTLFFHGMLILQMNNIIHGQYLPLKQLANVVAQRYWRLLLFIIVYDIILIAGLVLLIIPGIVFGVLFYFGMVFVVIENLSLGDSLKKSWYLVRHHWWRTFGVTISALVIYIGIMIGMLLIGLVFIAVLSIPFGFMHAMQMGNASGSILLIFDIVLISIFSVLAPMTPAFTLMQYYDLKLRQLPPPAGHAEVVA